MGHPALEIEQLLHNFPNLSKVVPKDKSLFDDDDEKDISICLYTINLAATSKEEVGKIPILAKCVGYGCSVDMVKLPDVFLEHPNVRVREINNEMTIRDSITDQFIARKIIYND